MSASGIVRSGAVGAALGAASGLLIAVAGVVVLGVLSLGPDGQYVGSFIIVVSLGLIAGVPSGTALGLLGGALAGLLDGAFASRLPRWTRWFPAASGAAATLLPCLRLTRDLLGEVSWSLSAEFVGALVLTAAALAACRHGLGRWPCHRLLRRTRVAA